VRTAIREAAAEDGLSLATIARRAGVKPSTFNAWLHGTYKGINATISRSAHVFLRSRAAQAAVQVEARPRTPFVMTPSAEAFMHLLEQAQFECDMVTLTGEPGVGKTTAIRQYQALHSNVWILTGEPGMKSPYVVLEHLDELFKLCESPSRRSRAIATFLRGRQGLLIIDEAQNLGLPALDQLRVFHDQPEVRVGLALVGHPDARNRMLNGGPSGKFAQLDSRFGMHMKRASPLASDVAAMLDAEGIADEDQRKLLRAAASKPGALRRMDRMLRLARQLARGEGTPELTAQHIVRADLQMNSKWERG
jgi:DNA transposition AAA+ family ATPase